MAFDPLAIFTGAPLDQAGADTRTALANLQSRVGAGTAAAGTAGTNALLAGQTGALGALGPAYDTARSDINAATGQAAGALYGGQTLASGALTGSVDPALAALYGGVSGAEGAYSPLLTAANQYGSFGTPSAQMIADANGLNGPEGVARAQRAFQTSPGFEFALNTGIDAATRGANATGMGASGNTLAELTRYGTGLGQQDYGNWLQRLQQQAALYSPLQSSALGAYGSGVGNARLTGGTGAANIITGTGGKLADLYSGVGGTAANLYSGAGKSLADLAVGGGTAAANVYTGTGQSLAALLAQLSGQNTSFAQSTVAPIAKSYEDAGLASMLGSQNLWGALGNAVTFGGKQGWFGGLTPSAGQASPIGWAPAIAG